MDKFLEYLKAKQKRFESLANILPYETNGWRDACAKRDLYLLLILEAEKYLKVNAGS